MSVYEYTSTRRRLLWQQIKTPFKSRWWNTPQICSCLSNVLLCGMIVAANIISDANILFSCLILLLLYIGFSCFVGSFSHVCFEYIHCHKDSYICVSVPQKIILKHMVKIDWWPDTKKHNKARILSDVFGGVLALSCRVTHDLFDFFLYWFLQWLGTE